MTTADVFVNICWGTIPGSAPTPCETGTPTPIAVASVMGGCSPQENFENSYRYKNYIFFSNLVVSRFQKLDRTGIGIARIYDWGSWYFSCLSIFASA